MNKQRLLTLSAILIYCISTPIFSKATDFLSLYSVLDKPHLLVSIQQPAPQLSKQNCNIGAVSAVDCILTLMPLGSAGNVMITNTSQMPAKNVDVVDLGGMTFNQVTRENCDSVAQNQVCTISFLPNDTPQNSTVTIKGDNTNEVYIAIQVG